MFFDSLSFYVSLIHFNMEIEKILTKLNWKIEALNARSLIYFGLLINLLQLP